MTVKAETSQEPTGCRSGKAAGKGSFYLPSGPRRWGCSSALCAQVLLEEGWSPRSIDIGLQAHRRDKLKPETARPTNTRDNQMVKGKGQEPYQQKARLQGIVRTQLFHDSKF